MLIEAAGAPPDKPSGTGPTGPRSTSSTGNATGSALGSASREVLAAQESMRREIARQMHDGPAQSIANIALEAQIGISRRAARRSGQD